MPSSIHLIDIIVCTAPFTVHVYFLYHTRDVAWVQPRKEPDKDIKRVVPAISAGTTLLHFLHLYRLSTSTLSPSDEAWIPRTGVL